MKKVGWEENSKELAWLTGEWIKIAQLAGQCEFVKTHGQIGQIFCQRTCHGCAEFGKSVTIYLFHQEC